MEAETADLLDRRMMQLFGVAHHKLEANDVKNVSANLLQARNGDANNVYGGKMCKMIEKGIPEIGLTSRTECNKKHASGVEQTEEE